MSELTAAQAGQVAALSGAAEGPSAEQVAQVAESLARLTRSVERRRQQFVAAARHDVEWSAHLLLHAIAKCGPVRASALAERVRSDPSTVSRQVAALVKDGLLERQADPEDGRASLLVLTERGERAHADLLRIRNEHYARMFAGWSERDCRRFAGLLARFTEQFDATETAFLAAVDANRRVAADQTKELPS